LDRIQIQKEEKAAKAIALKRIEREKLKLNVSSASEEHFNI
jgi:hypothetical protein